MIRILLVVALWVLTLCMFSVDIKWADGWRVKLTGWPEAIGKWWKQHKEAE